LNKLLRGFLLNKVLIGLASYTFLQDVLIGLASYTFLQKVLTGFASYTFLQKVLTGVLGQSCAFAAPAKEKQPTTTATTKHFFNICTLLVKFYATLLWHAH